MSVLDSFSEWKTFLADRIDQAQKVGMNQDTIANVAYQIGDYLSEKVDPKNNEERLLKDLWDASSEEEQKIIAGVLVKMLQKQ